MLLKIFTKIKNNPSLLFLNLIVLIPVLTMSYFLVSDYYYREEAEVKKNEQMAEVLAQNLDSYLDNVKATLISVSTLPPVQNRDRPIIETIFEGLMLADNQVIRYWAADVKGQIIAMHPYTWQEKQDEVFINDILKKPNFISGPRVDPLTGLEIITLSTLITDRNGNLKGVVGAAISLENLTKKLLLKVGTNGFPVLVTKTGTFLVHPKMEKINKKIKIEDPIFQASIKGGSGTLDRVDLFDNKRKFFSYVPLKQADWIVVVIQPLSEFHAQTFHFFTRNGVIIILAIFVVVLGAYYLILFRKREEEARISHAEKLSVVGQLAAGMAHEIRNPLTTIKGFAQLAATREVNTLDYLNIIISEVDRIESIVKETMLLAKPTPVEFKTVNLQQLIEELQALVQPLANQKEVRLFVTIEEYLPTIVGESNHLKQVFINLIKNSVEAVPDTGGQIFLNVKKTNFNIIIIIQDNGCGIPPKVLEKLGTPFVSTKENGTGLGIMVSYRIIQNHGGKIKVQSTQGEGTIFTIELPINTN